MGELIRLLLVEDDERDAELIRLKLGESGFELAWSRVDSERDLLAELARGNWDVIISDFAMPAFDGLKAFGLVQEICPEVPFIFVSGVLGEERAVEAMRSGARDYLLKGNLARLPVAVEREIAASKTRQSERTLEANVRDEHRRLTTAVEASGAGIFELRAEPHAPLHVNSRFLDIFGVERDELRPGEDKIEWVKDRIHADDLSRLILDVEGFVSGRANKFSTEVRVLHKLGHWVDAAIFANALARDSSGRALHVTGVVLDVTERRKLELQLRQAQKMEAVGRLAGGVAHDFNNLLTAIFSFGEFAQRRVEKNSPEYGDIGEVLKAAKRAHSLTSQLLAFSRRKVSAPKVVDVNSLLHDIKRMLERVVGEDVIVETRLSSTLGNVRIDPGHLEQVIVNIAVNARDAMPQGGTFLIETRSISVSASGSGASATAPNGYVEIVLSDEGVGMDEETRSQIYEPFFTTKGVGVGTGLGLSTCYGIINQAGGSISVESVVSLGTTFRVRLPATSEQAREVKVVANFKRSGGAETVLVVEDEEQLRSLTVRVLSELGYQVIDARDGEEALRRLESFPSKVHLLLADVIMPNLGGRALAERLKKVYPDMKVIFMSGYATEMIDRTESEQSEAVLLEKPFRPDELSGAVRRVLDSGARDLNTR